MTGPGPNGPGKRGLRTVAESRDTEDGMPTALVRRWHVDLLRVSSALCRG
jgi:hypothetical protein